MKWKFSYPTDKKTVQGIFHLELFKRMCSQRLFNLYPCILKDFTLYKEFFGVFHSKIWKTDQKGLLIPLSKLYYTYQVVFRLETLCKIKDSMAPELDLVILQLGEGGPLSKNQISSGLYTREMYRKIVLKKGLLMLKVTDQ